MRKRTGGTVINVIIGLVVLWLCFSTIFFYMRNLGQISHGGSSSAVEMTSTANSITATNSTLTESISSASVADNFSLAQLETLSFSNSSKCEGLLNATYWDTVIQTSGNTTAHLIPNTVYGLTQSWNGWADFFRTNMSNPPPWLPSGVANYTSSIEAQLAATVMGTKNVTLAAAVMKNYTAYLGAFEATGVDLLSWGGISAVKVYYQTGDFRQAVAQTFPGQLDQLLKLSQDCTYSEQQRAQFLGMALSMGALVLATSGKDGFGPQFQDLLTKLGMRDAWPGIRGDLKGINDASPSAAYETTTILAEMAKKFPAQFSDLASFTSSRIAVMVQVLKEKGLSQDEIAQQVAQLAQAVQESGDEDHVAEVADKISYQSEGSLRVTIGSDNTAVLLSFHAVPHYLTASLLASIVPGFKVGEATALKVTVHKFWYRTVSYEVYQGGNYLRFVLPSQLVKPGDKVGLSFELLSVEDFMASIPEITLSNSAHLNWVADAATLKDFKVVDGALKFTVLQNNPWSSVKEFTVKGELVNYPGVTTYFGGIYAEFAISDYAGRTTDIRIRFDGFTFNGAGLQAVTAGNRAVSLVSYDGFRLQFISGPENKVTTVYIKPPSESIYSLGEMRSYSGPYLDLVQGRYTSAWQIDSVAFLRNLEKGMLESGGTYDLGRLGSEISYVIGDRNLGLKNINTVEPSVGGRDLYTQDNTVAIQARFLKNFKGDRDTMIQKAISDLTDKLQQDYENQDKMQNGYAILSYLDTDGTVKTIILEVPRL